MNRNHRVPLRSAVCWILTVLLLQVASVRSEDTSELIVAGDPWCPFNCDEKIEVRQGYVVEALRHIARQNKVKLVYRITPWPRALKELREGSIDMAIGVSNVATDDYDVSRLSWGRLHQAYITLSTHHFKWSGLKSLDTKRVLFVKDYDYGAQMNNWIVAHPTQVEFIHGEKTNEQALNMLIYDRADVFINSAEALKWFLRDYDDEEKFSLSRTGQINNFHLAFSKHRDSSSSWRDRIDEGLKKLRASGELTSLLKQYGMKDWETE